MIGHKAFPYLTPNSRNVENTEDMFSVYIFCMISGIRL